MTLSHRKIILLGVLIASVSMVPIAAAQQASVPNDEVSLTCNDEELTVDYGTVTQLANANTDAIPGPLKSFMGANTIELEVENADQQYYTITTDSSMKITQLSLGQPESPDLMVQSDRTTACEIYTADQPANAFQTEYQAGNIDVEANGAVKSAVVSVTESLSDLFL